MSRSTDIIQFLRPAPGLVVTAMGEVATGGGWVNLQAVLDDDEDGEGPQAKQGRAGIFAMLSGRGPDVPVATWVPGTANRHGRDPDSLGIQHGSGPRAVQRLADAGVTFPEGWRRLADHPKRGLVLELPDGADPATLLDWLFVACQVLASAPLPDEWAAEVHRR